MKSFRKILKEPNELNSRYSEMKSLKNEIRKLKNRKNELFLQWNMIGVLKNGTMKKIKMTTKINLDQKTIEKINEIYSHLEISPTDSLIHFHQNFEIVNLGHICGIHDYIIKYLLNADNYNSFSDFIQQRPKHSSAQIPGHEDLVVDGMEERFINEEYAPKDELKIELPKPFSISDKIECPVCMELVAQIVVCKNCGTKYCYRCCCEQARRTGRCPICNQPQVFSESL